MPDDALGTEYYKLLELVTKFDERLMTVKGWGATVSLAALVVGFQSVAPLPGPGVEKAAGSFLAACLSGLSFWAIDAAMKRHQMRYYVRMREIEVVRAEEHERDGGGPAGPSAALRSSPQIDWSWSTALDASGAGGAAPRSHPRLYQGRTFSRLFWWLYPHVALPHALAVIAGGVFYLLWRADGLGLVF